MAHETDEPNNECPAPDALDVEYRELMELAGPDGCKCGIPQCLGHEVIGGRIFMETHPLGPIVIEWPDKDGHASLRNRMPSLILEFPFLSGVLNILAHDLIKAGIIYRGKDLRKPRLRARVAHIGTGHPQEPGDWSPTRHERTVRVLSRKPTSQY